MNFNYFKIFGLGFILMAGLCGLIKAEEAGSGSSSSACLEDFEGIAGWEKQGGAQFEADGSFTGGKGAIKVTMPGLIFKKVTPVKPRVQESLNDGYEGFSFWAKGDGSDFYGTLVLCGQHPLWFPFKYAYSFPLKSTEWKKYTVSWEDCIPEDPVFPIGTPGGMPPSGIQNLKIGNKWAIYYNNKPIPKHSYSIGHIQFEESVPVVKNNVALKNLSEVTKLFSEKKPVHILCLGDSITAGTSLAKPDEQRYAQVLEGLLRKKFGYDAITVESKAVGGAQGNDLRLWIDRDIPVEAPDLIIIMYGYNDKTWAYPKEYYSYSLNDYLDRIARKTNGATAVLMMPPIPGIEARFYMMDDYADTVRAICKSRNISLCDINKVFKDLGREAMKKIMADAAHPNPEGHVLIANTIADYLTK